MAGADFSAFEALSVGTTAVGFTAATYGAASHALIYIDGGPVRMRLDGTAPTASVGIMLNQGQTWILENQREIAEAQFISVDSGTYTVQAQFGVAQ